MMLKDRTVGKRSRLTETTSSVLGIVSKGTAIRLYTIKTMDPDDIAL
jgi:hypothetical protein